MIIRIIIYLLEFIFESHSCPVDDKLISRFRGTWSDTGVYETQVYAYMKTFRFTGSPALYIECDVRMCHGRCPVCSITSFLLKIISIYNYYPFEFHRVNHAIGEI